jgi:hypothetical protein
VRPFGSGTALPTPSRHPLAEAQFSIRPHDRARATYGAGYLPKSLLAADLDGDGRDDLVIGSVEDGALRVLMSGCP